MVTISQSSRNNYSIVQKRLDRVDKMVLLDKTVFLRGGGRYDRLLRIL